jgi:hypothetical protein
MEDGTFFSVPFLVSYITNTSTSSALGSLSFGALRKAQRTLDRTHVDSDSDAGEESDTSHSTEDQRPSDDPPHEKRERGGGLLRAKEIKKGAAIAAHKTKHA